MAQSFNGFSPELFDFLRLLAKNNNRDWFNANKDQYKNAVVAPVGDFIASIGDRFRKTTQHFKFDPRPNGGSMFRIYRDTRFSKDKRPYKENVGCQFRHLNSQNAYAPCYYVHLEPGKSFVGAGIWNPGSTSLYEIRQAIADDEQQWLSITKNKAIKSHFGELQGERLKRPPKGYDSAHPLIEDLKLKSFLVSRNVADDVVTGQAFIKEVEKSFKIATPLVQFVTEAVGLPFN